MKQEKMYRYLGKNGLFTTHIELLKIDPLPMVKLIADKGKLLTDGEEKVYFITTFPEEVDKWTEVDDPYDNEQVNNN